MVLFMSRAVIFVNGHIPDLNLVHPLIRSGDMILAANGGTSHALALGLIPSTVIGDLDSLSAEHRRQLDLAGTEFKRFPRDKNETDLELVLQFASDAGFSEILLVAALGGRLDQTMGNLALLTNPQLSSVDLRMDDGVEEVLLARQKCQIRGEAGDLVSLIPWGGEVSGVVTEGLSWPLCSETLSPYKTRGIGNEMVDRVVSISLESGQLLIVHRRLQKS
jgi:thiamine pyrophosphokinase